MPPEKKKYEVTRAKRLRTDPDVVRRREARRKRIQEAYQLRVAGASYQDIVNAGIGYNNVQAVGNDIRKALQDFVYETPEDVLVLDLGRLDAMQRKLSMAFFTGDLAQAGMILRVMQFRRETLGITPEVIAQRSTESKALVNNGIMVVQGSAEDYLKSMMQAAGATPEQQQQELERVAASNRAPGRIAPTEAETEILDAEVVEEPVQETARKKLRKPRKLKKSVEHTPVEKILQLDDELDTEELERRLIEVEQNDSPLEKLPSLQLSDPLLSIDFPDEKVPRKKRLRIKVKVDDPNISSSPGIPYKSPPRKPTREETENVLVGKGARRTYSGPNRHFSPSDKEGEPDGVGMYDEIEVETEQEIIE